MCRKLLLEKQRNAPKTRNAYDGVNDAGNGSRLSAENVGDKVKLKKTDQQPVDGSDDGDNQRSVVKHGFASFLDAKHRAFIGSMSGPSLSMHTVENLCLNAFFYVLRAQYMHEYMELVGFFRRLRMDSV